MTSTTESNTETFSGNGVSTSFSFGVKSQNISDITATYIDLLTARNELVLGTDFSVVLNADGSSTITYPLGTSAYSTLATGETLELTRLVPLTQTISLDNQGPYNPQTVETSLDKLTQMIQQNVPDMPAGADYYTYYDNLGKQQLGVTHTDLASYLAGAATFDGADFVASISILKAIVSTTLSGNEIRYATGYYVAGDTGTIATYKYISASTATDDGGSVIIPDDTPATGRWILQTTANINVKMFGATGDGVTDDTTAILNTFTAARFLGIKTIINAGTYLVNDLDLTFNEAGQVDGHQIKGQGSKNSIFKFTASTVSGMTIHNSGTGGFSIRNIMSGFTLDMTDMANASTRTGLLLNKSWENDFFDIDVIPPTGNTSARSLKCIGFTYVTTFRNCVFGSTTGIIEFAGNSGAGDNITTMALHQCSFAEIITSDCRYTNLYSCVVQGNRDKFSLGDNTTHFCVVGGDIEGSGILWNIMGTANILGFQSIGVGYTGFSGTWTSGEANISPDNAYFDSQYNYGQRNKMHARYAQTFESDQGIESTARANGFGAVYALKATGNSERKATYRTGGDVAGGTVRYEQKVYNDPSLRADAAVLYNANSGNFVWSTNGTPRVELGTTGAFALKPAADGGMTLGTPSDKWGQIYSTIGSISTSDFDKKTFIDSIPNEVLDAWGLVEYCQYKFKDAVEKKGDEARLHVGVVAQQIHKVFEDAGLNAFDYGLLCYDEWDAREEVWSPEIEHTHDEKGKKLKKSRIDAAELIRPAREAGSLWSIRASECDFMESAYMRRELTLLKGQ